MVVIKERFFITSGRGLAKRTPAFLALAFALTSVLGSSFSATAATATTTAATATTTAATATTAPTIDFSAAAPWVKPATLPETAELPATASVNYLLADHQVNISQSGEQGSKRTYLHYAMQATSEQGLSNVSEIELSFQPAFENLTLHHISVTRDGKVLNRLQQDKLKLFQREDDLKNKIYQEQWTVLAILEDVRVGDIVDYSYSIVGSNPVLGDKYFGRSPLSWGVPLEKSSFRLIDKADSKVSFRQVNTTVTPNKVSRNGLDEYTLVQHKIDPVREDDYTPVWHNDYAYIEYSQYANWQEVNQWAQQLYQLDMSLPDELKTIIKAQQQSSDQGSDQSFEQDKLLTVAKTTQWIQDNVRYFGIELGANSHLPSSPATTFDRRYGDCKDKTVLLIAVLKQLGIKAYPALVSTTETKTMTELLPSPGAFDHVIVNFEHQGKTYWVDGTMSNQRGTFEQMSFPDFAWSLVVAEDGHQLTEMLPLSKQQLLGTIKGKDTITIGKLAKNNQLTVNKTYSGYRAEQMRSYFDSVGITAASQDFLDYYVRQYKNIAMTTPVKVIEGADGSSLSIEAHYTISAFENVAQSRNLLTLYPTSIIESLQLPDIRQRHAPFSLPYHLGVEQTIEIISDDKQSIVWPGDLDNKEAKNPWFDYARKVSKKDQNIVIHYTYNSLATEVAADKFAEYEAKLDDIDGSLGYSLWLYSDRTSDKKKRKSRVSNLVKKLMNKNVD